MIFGPEKYEKGVWLDLTISRAAIEVDTMMQGKNEDYPNFRKLKTILQNHYDKTKSQNQLDYLCDESLHKALVFDVIPKTFNITRENCRGYDLPVYLAGLELVLGQFQSIESASPERLTLLLHFICDLGQSKLAHHEKSVRYAA
ncbi:MAG: hypothetical protein AABX17_02055 [Nanoarchaeota archaeon]